LIPQNKVANCKIPEWALRAALNMVIAVAELLPPGVKEKALRGYSAICIFGERNST